VALLAFADNSFVEVETTLYHWEEYAQVVIGLMLVGGLMWSSGQLIDMAVRLW
jgi:hypothetical protein